MRYFRMSLMLMIGISICSSALIAQTTLSGRVYEGSVGDQSNPFASVTVQLYGSNNSGDLGGEITSTITDATGWYGLTVREGYEYYTIVQSDYSNFVSDGATSVSGTVVNANQIQYTIPLSGKTLTGNKFWDKGKRLEGKVFKGEVGDETNPLQGVTVQLYGSNTADQLQTLVATTSTDQNGWYGLRVSGFYDLWYIVEIDQEGYNSTGATSVGGTAVTNNWIEYLGNLGSSTLTGNKFWDTIEEASNNPPVADANGPYTGTVNQPVTFDGSGSYDPDPGDTIVKYEWDMDHNGSYDDATGVNPQYTFSTAGSGIVGLKVTDSHGATDNTEASYNIFEEQVDEEYDWGDAIEEDPFMYPTTAALSGANHLINPDVRLGAAIDPDLDGQPTFGADGDDLDGFDDEDGVTFTSPVQPDQPANIDVDVTTSGFLNAWFDFDMNGSWGDPGEQIFSDEPLVAGTNVLAFFVPASAAIGDSYARFRFSTQQGLSYTGTANDGEVEDYLVPVQQESDAIDPGTRNLPSQYMLHPNYPNPFNPSTTISFDLPVQTEVKLIVLNIKGEAVAVLADGLLDAGQHCMTWDGTDLHGQLLSTGIYMYRLEAGNYVMTRKLLFVK